MVTEAPHKPRAQSREAYRLWFEFLRRAIAENKHRVKLDLYSEWGDVSAFKSFDAWWREVGSKVISLHSESVELVSKGSADAQTYLIRVPKSMSSTEIGNGVRKCLMAVGHEAQQTSKLRIAAGKEIRPQTYRAYLHAYDLQKKLEQSNSSSQRVKGKDLLIALRKFYLDREKRYKNHSTIRVDRLPSALIAGMIREDLNEVDVLANATALNAVSRYLREAKSIIAAVSDGRFPD